MNLKPPDTIQDAARYLSELNGATIEWWGFTVSHGICLLRVTGLERGICFIFMAATQYIHFPTVMHNARLRVATNEETEALRLQLPPKRADLLERKDHLVIEAEEGLFAAWARNISITSEQTHVDRFFEFVSPDGLPDGTQIDSAR